MPTEHGGGGSTLSRAPRPPASRPACAASASPAPQWPPRGPDATQDRARSTVAAGVGRRPAWPGGSPRSSWSSWSRSSSVRSSWPAHPFWGPRYRGAVDPPRVVRSTTYGRVAAARPRAPRVRRVSARSATMIILAGIGGGGRLAGVRAVLVARLVTSIPAVRTQMAAPRFRTSRRLAGVIAGTASRCSWPTGAVASGPRLLAAGAFAFLAVVVIQRVTARGPGSAPGRARDPAAGDGVRRRSGDHARRARTPSS